MSLITRCTHCGTSFKLTHAQLNARAGQVRCGRCSKVFDAYARLISTDGATLPARPLPPEPPAAEPLAEAAPAPRQEAAAPPVPAPPSNNGPATLIDPFEDTRPRQRKKSTLRYEQTVRPEPVTRPRRSAILLGLAALLLLGLLGSQMLFHWRDAIVAFYPQTRNAMETFCQLAGCQIGFFKQPDKLSIETSSLEADPKDSSVVILRATLRNRAPFPQGFPALELTLTDIKDEPVARRVFMPEEYKGTHIKGQGIEANAEVHVQVRMQLVGLKAQGYRLYLFYPRQT